uniref:uncharacterized protein LOC114671489 n=1 Tax=Macaca mulatta TaxID=9544 RepID=UPI0010A24203|nr:uncharacterized protein LOC114671489 [Macaca mulatta]
MTAPSCVAPAPFQPPAHDPRKPVSAAPDPGPSCRRAARWPEGRRRKEGSAELAEEGGAAGASPSSGRQAGGGLGRQQRRQRAPGDTGRPRRFAPAQAAAPARPAPLLPGSGAHLPGKWRLSPCSRGHRGGHFRHLRSRCAELPGFVCVLAAVAATPRLGSPAPWTARRVCRTRLARTARAPTWVKLRPSVDSRENLLKPGVERKGDSDRQVSGFPSRPCWEWVVHPRPWGVGACPLGRGGWAVGPPSRRSQRAGLKWSIRRTSARKNKVWFFGSFAERLSGSSSES